MSEPKRSWWQRLRGGGEDAPAELQQPIIEPPAPPVVPPPDIVPPPNEPPAEVPPGEPPAIDPPGEPPLHPPGEPPSPVPVPPPAPEEPPQRVGWYQRLRQGLSRSSGRLKDSITSIFTGKRLDEDALEELEEALIAADLGVETAAAMVADLAKERFGKDVTDEEVRGALAHAIAATLEPVAQPLTLDPGRIPNVVLVCGVNGTGKTTTIGKLARQFVSEGRSVVLAAGDTFRAAAIEQLQVWGQRTGCAVVSRPTGADAAGLAFDALEQARRDGAEVVLIDTAGRLHNKAALMDELAKVVRVLRKLDPEAPHHTLLVLDATTGQNARAQVETFAQMVPVSGLIVTKLDGTARGGVVVSLASRFGLPVHAVGVGEGADDLRPFEARHFAEALLGIERS